MLKAMYWSHRFYLFLTCLFLGIQSLGCGGGSDSPERFQLSGTVGFEGAPVAYGEILFIPDSEKGNSGAGTVVTIKDGQYQTQEGKGVIGGPYRVQIQGLDAPPIDGAVPAAGESAPKQLFKKYETKVDFPREPSTYNFVIPNQ